ncbi:hypothetical protein SAMN05519104_5141 [Rhizobiales bacterium GAS188]|nr:hypothetical protein SAMN05519104_5141 [Rhizobiales bacterium GAS188]
MTHINTGRVVLGGVVAAIVLFIVSGIVNGAILGSSWQAWLQAMGSLNHAPAEPAGLALWAIVSLVFGLTGVWIYAGIRPRYAPGRRPRCWRVSCFGSQAGLRRHWAKSRSGLFPTM